MAKKKLLESEIVRFNPQYTQGLNSEQIEERNKQGLVNITEDVNKKGYMGIIVKNVFTFFSSTSATDGISCLINFVLVYLSISLIFLISFPNTNENDIPLLPALPVLPILCT